MADGTLRTMIELDTDPRFAAAQRAAWERLGPEGRLKLALEMSEFVRKLALVGLRARHPGWSDAELRREVARMAFPPDRIPVPLR